MTKTNRHGWIENHIRKRKQHNSMIGKDILPITYGPVAQLGERLNGIQEVSRVRLTSGPPAQLVLGFLVRRSMQKIRPPSSQDNAY